MDLVPSWHARDSHEMPQTIIQEWCIRLCWQWAPSPRLH